MRSILLLCCVVLLLSFTGWQPDFSTAQKTAVAKHQLILLNFSGSDWCGPCIRMHKEIFGSTVFQQMSDTTLMLYNADFPRNKKNQLSAALTKQNEALADKYNPEGKFPFTLLLTADGKVLKTWDGYPKTSAEQFTSEVKSLCNAAQ
jgi:hypothetical protein